MPEVYEAVGLVAERDAFGAQSVVPVAETVRVGTFGTVVGGVGQRRSHRLRTVGVTGVPNERERRVCRAAVDGLVHARSAIAADHLEDRRYSVTDEIRCEVPRARLVRENLPPLHSIPVT